MSNLTHGMNLEEVEELGHALKERAKAISATAGQIDRRVHSTTWAGPDAEKFRGSWWPTHKAKLYATAKELDGLGQSALNNACEQRRVSGESVGSGGSGLPVTGEGWLDRAFNAGRNSALDPMLSIAGLFPRIGSAAGLAGLGLSGFHMVADVTQKKWNDLGWDFGGTVVGGGLKWAEIAAQKSGGSVGGVVLGGGALAWGVAGIAVSADIDIVRNWGAMNRATSDIVQRAQGTELDAYMARHGYQAGPAPGDELEYLRIQNRVSNRMLTESFKTAWHGSPGLSVTNRLVMPVDGLIAGSINYGMASVEAEVALGKSVLNSLRGGIRHAQSLF